MQWCVCVLHDFHRDYRSVSTDSLDMSGEVRALVFVLLDMSDEVIELKTFLIFLS